MGEFLGDLAKALKAWRIDPRLPLVTILVHSLLGSTTPFLLPLLFLAGLFSIGFVGAQRVWYVNAWRGERWSLREMWSTSWSFFGPFLVLGLIFLPIVFAIAAVAYTVPVLAFDLNERWGWFFTGVVVDMILTFVTPALVLTTPRGGRALSIGRRMIAEHWRHALPYILLPPMAIQAFYLSPDVRTSPAVAMAISVAVAVVALWFKGATVAFYLRHQPPPEEGALFPVASTQELDSSPSGGF